MISNPISRLSLKIKSYKSGDASFKLTLCYRLFLGKVGFEIISKLDSYFLMTVWKTVSAKNSSWFFQFILPITLISWAHHSIKQKLQKLPTWNKASQRKSLRKTNGCAIEAKNDEAEEALHSGIFDSSIFQVWVFFHTTVNLI